MRLHPDEPAASRWDALDDGELRERLRSLLPHPDTALILVDGRSGSGKSTLADRLSRLVDGEVVHSDDIAWHLDPIDWADVLLHGVVDPWRRGEPVCFRPPGWVSKGRPGAVVVAAGRALVVEGVGAGRATLATNADLVVWVQSDRDVARHRALARDVRLGRSPQAAAEFWEEWMRAEEPFLAADQPWSRATVVVNGTPPEDGTGRTLVAPGPLGC